MHISVRALARKMFVSAAAGDYQTCEEASSLVDASSGTPEPLKDFLEGIQLAFTDGASYETFIYGDYQYPGASLTSHFG